LHGVKADAADVVALLLHRDVKPILPLHGVALAFVVTGGVRLVGLLLRGIMDRFAVRPSRTWPRWGVSSAVHRVGRGRSIGPALGISSNDGARHS
jgi:hypothetical protein